MVKLVNSLARYKYAVLSVAVICAVVLLFVLINAVVEALDARFHLRVDLTRNELTGLSPQTKQILEELEAPVFIYTFFRTDRTSRSEIKLFGRVENIIGQYAYSSEMVSIENIDPWRNPAFAQQFDDQGKGIKENSVIVTDLSRTRFQVIDPTELFFWDEAGYPISIVVEQRITTAISNIRKDTMFRLKILQGHNEPSINDLSPMLRTFALTVPEALPINLMNDASYLDPEKDILVIINPKRDINEIERRQIEAFIDGGGKILACVDPLWGQELTNFRTLFKLFTVDLDDSCILEGNEGRYYQQPLVLVPELVPIPLLVQPLIDANIRPVLPFCRPIIIPQIIVNENIAALPLLETSPSAYIKDNIDEIGLPPTDGDRRGPFTLAAAAYIRKSDNSDDNAKLVIFGSSQFLTEPEMLNIQGNFSLALNCLGWLSSREYAISIPPKFIGEYPFVLTSASTSLRLIVVLFSLPILTVALGCVRCVMRRRL